VYYQKQFQDSDLCRPTVAHITVLFRASKRLVEDKSIQMMSEKDNVSWTSELGPRTSLTNRKTKTLIFTNSQILKTVSDELQTVIFLSFTQQNLKLKS
jgi:hypothetical protein